MGTWNERRVSKRYLLNLIFNGKYNYDCDENKIFRQALRKYKEEYYGK